LQIQGGFATPLLMAKMLGTCQQNFLNRLVLVDLSFSNQGLGLRQLGSDQLSALTKVQSLFLHQSGIEVIDVDAFGSFSGTINTINLADNQLSTLLNGTFDGMTKRINTLELYLEGKIYLINKHNIRLTS
jgi:hypothetical protein